MTNKKALDRFEQEGHGIYIQKMFWIAGSLESDELIEMLKEDFDAKDWSKLFPEMDPDRISGYLEEGTITQLFCDYNKFGFIAQLHFPWHHNFRFNGKNFQGCSVSTGVLRIEYAYAETIEGLLKEIERIAEECFQDDMKKDNKRGTSKNKTAAE